MLKKLLVCGASLLMVASVGTGINNVSARRVRHYRPRTHRVIRSSRSLYNLGHKDGENYVNAYNLAKGSIAGTGTPKEVRQSEEADKQYTYHFIEFNYNKSYAKGFHKGYRDAGTTMMANEPTATDAKRFAHKHHLNSKNAYSYFYGKHSTKRNRRIAKRHAVKRIRKSIKRTKRTKRIKSRKHNKRVMTKKHFIRKNKRHTVKRHARKQAKRMNKKPAKESIVKKSTEPTVNASNSNNSNQSTTNQPSDDTDGGKYYSWDQLTNLLGGPTVTGGFESGAEQQKIENTIKHNVDSGNYTVDQVETLNQAYAPVIQDMSPSLYNNMIGSLNNAESADDVYNDIP